MVRALFCFLVASFVVASATPAQAEPDAPPLAALLARALDSEGVSPALTGAIAIDIATGEVLFRLNETRPLEPASTEKLTVALAALARLGPSFRIETNVLGRGVKEGAVWQGDLVLKGYGDPTLDGEDLRRLARQVRVLGLRRVTGDVLADETFFDRRRTVRGWEPSFYKVESPPLSALAVDRARVDGVTLGRPALAAATALHDALERSGVEIDGKPAVGRTANEVVLLAQITSPPLARLVRLMNTVSDNYLAEILLKELGARELGRGTSAAGTQVVREVLEERSIPLEGVRIVDGSGLSRGDRLTAQALAALLVSARNDPELAGSFLDSLPIAGISGTLEDRLERKPALGRVQAKTGTTGRASSLAGYAGDRYVFAVLMNGRPITWSSARDGQDRFAELLAAQ